MIINSLIIIVGLLAVKAFIAFISGLIGGKDAQAEGSGMKKDLADVVSKAGSGAMLAANIGKRVGGGILGLGVAGAKLGNRIHNSNKVKQEAQQLENLEATTDSEANRTDNMRAAEGSMNTIKNDYKASVSGINLRDRVRAKAVAEGLDPNGADAKEFEAMYDQAVHEQLMRGTDADSRAYQQSQQVIANEGYSNAYLSLKTERQNRIAKADLNEDGSGAFTRAASKWARGVGAAFLKGLQEGLPDMGINLGKVKGVFNKANNNKYDDKGDITGTYGGHRRDTKEEIARKVAAGENAAPPTVKGFFKGLGNVLSQPFNHKYEQEKAPIGLKGPSDEKRTADTLAKMEQTNSALLKAVEKLNRANRS